VGGVIKRFLELPHGRPQFGGAEAVGSSVSDQQTCEEERREYSMVTDRIGLVSKMSLRALPGQSNDMHGEYGECCEKHEDLDATGIF
jgi:hypothetical protein